MNKWMLLPALAAVLTIGGVALASDSTTSPGAKNDEKFKLLTKEQAIVIAKEKAAGIVVDIELDRENNRSLYEIEIEDGKYEYDLEIDAITGEILKFKKELDNDDKQPTEKVLTKDEAIVIAKQKANGIVKSIELDEDDNRFEYEIEIEDKEYEFDIVLDAVTGEFIEFEKERNGNLNNKESVNIKKLENTTSKENTLQVVEPAKRITKDQAIAIAKQQAVGSVTDFELDDNVYEIEISDGAHEYDIEVDVITGEILKFEKDDN